MRSATVHWSRHSGQYRAFRKDPRIMEGFLVPFVVWTPALRSDLIPCEGCGSLLDKYELPEGWCTSCRKTAGPAA